MTPKRLLIVSLEHSVWNELRDELDSSLGRLQLRHLLDPTMLLLRELITRAVDTLHYKAFKQTFVEAMGLGSGDEGLELDALYKAELAEHGDYNISAYCESRGLCVALEFPCHGESIVNLILPANCCDCVCIDSQLAEALGYRLQNSRVGQDPWFCLISLEKHLAGRRISTIPHLIERHSELESLQSIYAKLGYGLAEFAGDGSIITASPQIPSILKMDSSDNLVDAFCKLIPSHFFKDIIWGMALTSSNGVFENYRVRLQSPREKGLSVLFNVSGYRGDDAVIYTLWQAISLEAGENDKLSEGSILNEARVHNITRKYVPQLVEKKAREAVRLGYTELTNEEQLIAVLFCDIVGFTSYVENNEGAESIINTLNSILRRVSSSVKRYGGAIDKFMGDCVMALFANPADAIMAALAMQRHAVDMNDLRTRAGLDSLQFRIGINWGTVIVGNLGTAERLDWTAIGDVVNTVSRIEKSCKPGAVLISQAARDAVAEIGLTNIAFGETFYISAKGKRDKQAVCYVGYAGKRGKKRALLKRHA